MSTTQGNGTPTTNRDALIWLCLNCGASSPHDEKQCACPKEDWAYVALARVEDLAARMIREQHQREHEEAPSYRGCLREFYSDRLRFQSYEEAVDLLMVRLFAELLRNQFLYGRARGEPLSEATRANFYDVFYERQGIPDGVLRLDRFFEGLDVSLVEALPILITVLQDTEKKAVQYARERKEQEGRG
jgi:hypothetical protein